jgi:replication initiation protein RepC
MTYMPVTSFRRPVTAVQMERARTAHDPLPQTPVNKWEVLRELAVARRPLGLNDRALVVLQALLSFHPGSDLGGDSTDLIVFPSNAAICDRLNGMPCSTMRRHLATLVAAGLIVRRDSPNGKRYARRAVEGRDAVWAGLADLAADTARALRRTLAMDELRALEQSLSAALTSARDILESEGDHPASTIGEAEYMSTRGRQIEQHHQISRKDSHDSEPCIEDARPGAGDVDDQKLPRVPLYLVRQACRKIQDYAQGEIRHWHQLVGVAEFIRPMMGISPSAWEDAKSAMGPEESAVVLAAILERFSDLRSPGGYLRALTAKAAAGSFSCSPMVMALLRRGSA